MIHFAIEQENTHKTTQIGAAEPGLGARAPDLLSLGLLYTARYCL